MDNSDSILALLHTKLFWFNFGVSVVASFAAGFYFWWSPRPVRGGVGQASSTEVKEAAAASIGPVVAAVLLSHAVLAGFSFATVSLIRKDDLTLSVSSGIFALLIPWGILWTGRASPAAAVAQVLLSAAVSILLVLAVMPEWIDLIPTYGLIAVCVLALVQGFDLLRSKTE